MQASLAPARSEAAFLVRPVLLTAAMAAGSLSAGLHTAIWIVALLVVSGAGLLAVYPLGGDESAYESPPLTAPLRGR